jgi:predicted Zn-dependent protease
MLRENVVWRNACVSFLPARLRVLALTLACGCVVAQSGLAQAIEPFSRAPTAADLAPEEDRLWGESREASTALRRRGLLFNQDAYTARLNVIMRALYPEFGDSISVRVLREIAPNAMAFPNGDVYFSLGLLGRLENEAQIAMVLAHEGAHFVHRHGLQGRNTRLTTGTLVQIVGFAGGAVGTLGALGGALGGQIALIGGVAGHSRDMEREADRVGLERVLKLGYGRADARRAFEVLRDYAKTDASTGSPYFFASHPKLEERIESISVLPGSDVTTAQADPAFAAMHHDLQLQWLPLELGAGRYKALAVALEDDARRARMPAQADYYLSEAYRLRGDAGDVERAADWLARAYKRTPDYPPLLRSAGLAAMKAGQRSDARTFFSMYLMRQPDASDRGFVESYLKQLAEEESKK